MYGGDAGAVAVVIEECGEHVRVRSLAALDEAERDGRETAVLDLNAVSAKLDPAAIRHLSLSRCELACVPDALAGLQLRALDLSHNSLERVPDCLLRGLRLVEDLNLAHNKLRRFDAEPRCVLKLRSLRLNDNRLENVPAWVLAVACLNLEEFYYSRNRIASLKQSRFRSQSSYRLRKIEMRNCLMRLEDLRFLKDVRSLKGLDISNEPGSSQNCFVNECFAELFSNPLWEDRLTVLCMNGLEISFLPEDIGRLISLEELYVSRNYIYWLPQSLTSLQKLRVLDMSHNHLVSLPEGINAMTSLEVLKLSYNGLSSTPDFRAVNLKQLDLYNNYVDVESDIQINWDILTQLDLEQNYLNTDELNLLGYQEKKDLLRSEGGFSRCNGPKIMSEEVTGDGDFEWCTEDDSDLECDLGTTDHYVREVEEESWSPVPEGCDNGCTSSDNEWTGSESIYVVRKNATVLMPKDDDSLFEDD